jgi:hypothetical protein
MLLTFEDEEEFGFEEFGGGELDASFASLLPLLGEVELEELGIGGCCR